MKKRFGGYRWLGYVVVILTLVVIGLPALLVRGCSWESREPIKEEEVGLQVKLQVSRGEVASLPLEQYVIGVVAAEMPASFHPEALKAQAVAARTYTMLRLTRESQDEKHPAAHLCVDSGHCQAWIDTAEMRKRWGWHFRANYNKIAEAVETTRGQVLTYDGELIDPVYHASCGGRGTEDAREVWGHEVPYLISIPCTFDPPHRQEPVVTRLSLQEILTKLEISEQSVPAAAGSGCVVEIQERTKSGRVKSVKVGSQICGGVDLRKELGLRSTDFQVTSAGDEIIFTTRGYGHAVGMCQYGANGLADRGVKYNQILAYYYRGVKLETVQQVSK
ncbi:MAG: stage II sporulation protein D [Syntrophaceticus sp.]